MSSVDERVVELKFDNKQFEDGVKTSLGTLEKLKQGLKIEKAGKALDNLKVAGKNFDMSGVSSAVEAVTNKFSVLGTIGDQVLRRLTDSALRFGRNLMTAIPNQIISGGKRRAQNIEQAQFQLKGLMGDEFDWDVISKDLDYAVAGTAYGLDAAAKVASQLKASNIDFGEDMQQALRGISGVAAMTNSEYEEIGHIFTTIAGQGKLMTDQLNQFAGRGLNVAAELAKAYNVDEATLREMVTKGQVDFMTFAKAMNEAFGEHATKANETFTGALSNVKASLSRMGANFATPIYDNLKKIFNALLPLMKNVEKLVKPVAAAFSTLLDSAVTPLIGFMERLKVKFDQFLSSIGITPSAVKNVTEAVSGAVHTAEELEKIVQQVINGDFGNGEDRKKKLNELGWSYAQVQNRVNELLGCSKRYDESLEDEAATSKNLTGDLADMNKQREKTWRQNTKAMREGRSTIDMLKDTVLGVVSAVNILKSAGTAIIDHIIKPFAKFAIPKILGGILTVTSSIGRYLTALDIELTKNDTFNKFFGSIQKYAGIAYKAIQSFVKQAGDSFDRLKNMPGVKALVESLGRLKTTLTDLKNSVIESITSRIKGLAESFKSSGFDMSGFFTTFENVVNFLAGALAGLIDNLIKGGTAIGGFLGKFKGPAISLVKQLYEVLKNLFNVVTGAASSAFKMVSDAIGSIFDSISDVAILDTIATALESIKNFGLNIVDNVIRPFINYGLPSVLEKVSGLLSGIGDALGGIVDRLSSSDAFTKVVTVIGGAIRSAANAIVDFGTKVRDAFTRLKDSEGVQHLVESLSSLKDVALELVRVKFGEFVDFISGIGTAIGNVTGGLPKIDVFETIGSVLSTIADAAGTLIDAVIGKGVAISEFIAPFKDAAVDKIIEVAKAIGNLAKAVGSEGFKLIGSAGKTLSEFFKSLNGFEGFDKISKASASVNGVFDKTLGDPSSLKDRAFKSIKGIVDGITEAIQSLDFEKLLANAKTVAVIGLIIELIGLTKKVKEVTVGFGKTLDTIKKLPTKVVGVLDKFTETLNLYQKSIKADILIKVAYAIGILTLSVIALTNVDIPSLNSVAVALTGMALGLAALMWAYSKIMDNTAKVKESEAKLAEANKKEDPNPALVGIKDFLKKLGDAAAEAMKTVAQSISFVFLAAAVTILMGVVERIVALDLSLHQAINVGIELAALFALILAATFILSKIKNKISAKEAFGILEIAAAVYVLAEVASKISEIPDDQVLKAVGVIASFVAMFAVLAVASKEAKLEGLAGTVIGITAAIILMLIPLKVISEMDPDKLAKALEVIAMLMIGMGALALALGSAGPGAAGGSLAMIGIAAAILLLVPALILLGAAAPVAINGLKLLAGALVIFVVAGLAASLVAPGLVILTSAILGIGIAVLAAGVGMELFGLGLLTVAAAFAVLSVSAVAGAAAFGIALGLMCAGIINATADIVDAITHLGISILNALLTLIPGVALIGAEIVVAVMAGILTQIDNITVIGVAIVIAFINGVNAMMDAIVDAAVKLIIAFVNGCANALRENSQPILLAIGNLINAVSRFLVQALYDLTKDIPGVSDFFQKTLDEMDADAEWIMNEQRGYEKSTNWMDGLKQGVNDNLPDFAKNILGIKDESDAVFKEMSEDQDPYGKQFMHNRAKGLESGASEVKKATEQSNKDTLDSLATLKDQVGKYDIGIGDTITKSIEKSDYKPAFDTIDGDLSQWLGDVTQTAKTGGNDIGIALPEGIDEGVLSNMDLPQEAINLMDQGIIEAGREGLQVNSPSKVFEEIGQGVPEGMEKGIKGKTSSVQTVVTTMATTMITTMKARIIQFRTLGSDMGLNLVTGLKSMSSQAYSAGESVAGSAASGARTAYDSAYSAGVYTAQGIVSGVNSMMGKLYSIGASAGKKVTQGYKDNKKIESPSKEMRQLGRFTGEGLILGIEDKFSSIYQAGEEAGDRVSKAIESPLTRMLAILNDEADMNPTIKPVLDISDIEENAGKIQSLMPTSSVGLSFAASGAVRSAMSVKSTSDDVVSAINALNARLDNMPRGDVFNVGDVTYDDGTNVATAVRSLINAAKVQRRA